MIKSIINFNKIYIPFRHFHTIGGPSTFMKNLQAHLDHKSYPYTEKWIYPRSTFFPIQMDINYLKKLKNRGGTIIQRLDGIYYPSLFGDSFSLMNEAIKDIYLNYATFVIFQSEYSKKQCFEMLGKKKRRNTRSLSMA